MSALRGVKKHLIIKFVEKMKQGVAIMTHQEYKYPFI